MIRVYAIILVFLTKYRSKTFPKKISYILDYDDWSASQTSFYDKNESGFFVYIHVCNSTNLGTNLKRILILQLQYVSFKVLISLFTLLVVFENIFLFFSIFRQKNPAFAIC